MSPRRRQTKTRISRRKENPESSSPQFAAPPVIQPKAQRKTEQELPEWKPGGSGKPSPLQRLQPSATLQAKLEIGQPSDRYEQQANTVARDVVEQINSPVSNDAQQHTTVQRKTQESNLLLRLKPTGQQSTLGGGKAPTQLESSINHAKNGGKFLEPSLQRSMGKAMGVDFSGVKIHTDAQANQLSESIQAKAFTTGQNIFFKQGEYQPQNRGGQELIAHELTHVVQQQGQIGNAIQGSWLTDWMIKLCMSGEVDEGELIIEPNLVPTDNRERQSSQNEGPRAPHASKISQLEQAVGDIDNLEEEAIGNSQSQLQGPHIKPTPIQVNKGDDGITEAFIEVNPNMYIPTVTQLDRSMGGSPSTIGGGVRVDINKKLAEFHEKNKAGSFYEAYQILGEINSYTQEWLSKHTQELYDIQKINSVKDKYSLGENTTKSQQEFNQKNSKKTQQKGKRLELSSDEINILAKSAKKDVMNRLLETILQAKSDAEEHGKDMLQYYAPPEYQKEFKKGKLSLAIQGAKGALAIKEEDDEFAKQKNTDVKKEKDTKKEEIEKKVDGTYTKINEKMKELEADAKNPKDISPEKIEQNFQSGEAIYQDISSYMGTINEVLDLFNISNLFAGLGYIKMRKKAKKRLAKFAGAVKDPELATLAAYGYNKVSRLASYCLSMAVANITKFIARTLTLITGGLLAIFSETINLAMSAAMYAHKLYGALKGIYKAVRGTKGKNRFINAEHLYLLVSDGKPNAEKLLIDLFGKSKKSKSKRMDITGQKVVNLIKILGKIPQGGIKKRVQKKIITWIGEFFKSTEGTIPEQSLLDYIEEELGIKDKAEALKEDFYNNLHQQENSSSSQNREIVEIIQQLK
ncbi:DUF4157 domain-containing protein [Roseofilum sp. BLCC_M154]|uniref:DUF4157 domain-containing protein n=1 Tax=Roseofilum acuticapitatum BLCC-M154 TaxID=3022444 RepID=A0ABT7ASK7_9CYAN|nr:DUF4157 domain-containing protein [Roseofilum acuticapitatum]MDJ1169893.1 DUF4157 domain-containing protein [Roseofilum acuticapitatum BLCC-M154]